MVTIKFGEGVSERAQMFGLASGIIFFILFFGAWVSSGFLPPPPPGLSGEELWDKFGDRLFWIKLAMPIGLIGSIFLIPWSSVLALQVARLEKGLPFWAITVVGAGAANAVAFYLPFIFWAGAFYRPDRAPDLLLLINDMTWLEFIMVFPPTFVQMCAVGIAGLSYKGSIEVFPRWYYFLCIWTAILLIPGGLAIFFFDGPFAWDGILALWTPLFSYLIYILTSFVMVYKAIKNHVAEHNA